MFPPESEIIKLYALGAAKISFGCLRTIYRHLGSDLELGLVGFAVVLRTRRDWFDHIGEHGLTPETLAQLHTHPVFTTSIYEIATFTGMDRATVRRKLNKLAELGLVRRQPDRRWHLCDFNEDGSASIAVPMLQDLLATYTDISRQIEQSLPHSLSAMRARLEVAEQNLAPAALDAGEVTQRRDKGYVVGQQPEAED